MAFDPEHYRNEVILGGGDITLELSSRGLLQAGLWERIFVDQPDIVREIAGAFLNVGATVLATQTDRLNVVSSDVAVEDLAVINRAAAAAFREAADEFSGPERLVFGAVGPVEQLLTLSEIEEDELRAAYRAQSKALADGGVDAILCRSFSELEALVVAVNAAKEGADLPVVGSMIFDCGREHTETTMGVTVPQACRAMTEAGVSAVGCDNGEYPDATAAIVAFLRESCDVPIWAEINAGRAELEEDRTVYPEAPKVFAERFKPIAEAGATMIGGGYGASVDHIAEMARARERYIKKKSS